MVRGRWSMEQLCLVRIWSACSVSVAALVLMLLFASSASVAAAGGDSGRHTPDPIMPTVTAVVTTGNGPGGYYVNATVYQTVPGAYHPSSTNPPLPISNV